MGKRVVVVGNGLFGSIAATLARSRGHDVTVISSNEPNTASRAAGAVLAPSWMSSLSKDEIATSMSVLAELYKVHEVEFRGPAGVPFRAKRVDPDKVLVKADVIEEVTLGALKLLKADAVLLATGIWTPKLVGDMPMMRGFYGASVRFKVAIDEPRIQVWSPYRQSVLYQLSPSIAWFGDGTALIKRTWEAEREGRIQATLDRGAALIGQGKMPLHSVREGARPYVEGHKAGYFRKVAPKTWVATGGAKNGIALAALHAAWFVREARL